MLSLLSYLLHKEANMKKLTATAILMVVISVVAFGSVMSHIETITGLLNEWRDTLTWAIDDPISRCLIGAIRMQGFVDEIEIELIAAMQQVTSSYEAKVVLCAVCSYSGMQLGTDGMLELDMAKVTACTLILNWATAKINAMVR